MNKFLRAPRIAAAFFLSIHCACPVKLLSSDPIAELQADAIETKQSSWGHWGPDASKYSSWTTHSNRLIPIYTFGGDLKQVTGANSVYRNAQALKNLYGSLPSRTLNPAAEYCDQTDVYRLQQLAVESGKRRIILFVFDGMDWQTTRAAAIAKSGEVAYSEGRGRGLAFQDYALANTDFGFFVTSPHNDGTNVSVDKQTITNPGGDTPGGYDPTLGGPTPWASDVDANYLLAKNKSVTHAYTDSSSSAASMTCGIKTYNNGVNVDASGREAVSLARSLQEQGFAVGVVTSVPISHATPACAYASNVHRSDYQDLTRDLIGRPSIFHPGALPGLDVLLGAGWGETKDKDGGQGENFVAGNTYLTNQDRDAVSIAHGGQYVVVERTPGQSGKSVLDAAAIQAIADHHRLLGYFGVKGGHLPFQTADGGYNPVGNVGNPAAAKAEVYSPADIAENPNLAELAMAAVNVLESRAERWWLMVEAGDVDWANHSNNIDSSIGAVLSGENAFQQLTQWIEGHGGWDDTLLIVTADHGHYLVLDKPEMLTGH